MASTTNIEDWFLTNNPESPIETSDLHDAFNNLSDESMYAASRTADTIFVTGPNEPVTLVLPSIAAQNFFRHKLETYKHDGEWGFDEERDFYVDIENPNS